MPLSLARRIHSGRASWDDLREEAERTLGARRQRSLRPGRVQARAEKRAARKTKTQTNRDVREACMEREGGLCSVRLPVWQIGRCEGALHMDHQWGRGKAPTTVENCRMLCARHDRMKTENETEGGHSRAVWLDDFRLHAYAHEYLAEADRAENALALEQAQHPSPSPASPQETP